MLEPIKNSRQYADALDKAYRLLQNEIQQDSKQSDELEALSILIKEYENEHYPIAKPNPKEKNWNKFFIS